jgi:putative transcription factor
MPSRGAIPIAQDWTPVVIHKRQPKSSDLRDPKAVNAALRSGAEIQVTKKIDGGKNQKTPATAINARKLDQETEPLTFEKVAPEVKQAIQKARLEKKLTQVELAKSINEPPKVIQEYEAGKAIPNQQILAKLEKVLGVKLRGKMK